ncbi:MAG: hypothetical protein AAGM22_30870, partial [Acidobacteriota bacterium]
MNRPTPFLPTVACSLVATFLSIAPVHAGFLPGYYQNGVTQSVTAFATFDDGAGERLYAAGSFQIAGEVPVRGIASWDGAGWSALPGADGEVGLDSQVEALQVFDDGSGSALYIGGFFRSAGGLDTERIVRWDGTTWSDVGGGLTGPVYDLAIFDDGSGSALFAAGYFPGAEGGAEASILERWDGTAWSTVATASHASGFVPRGRALVVHDDGSGPGLFLGGLFTDIGDDTVNGLARWDGTAWSAVGVGGAVGIGGEVRALASYSPDQTPEVLYVGGLLSSAGGQPASRIARWNGAAWSTLPAGPDQPEGPVITLDTFDFGNGPRLLAGAMDGSTGTGTGNYFTTFDGASWSVPVTVQPDSAVRAFGRFDGPGGDTLWVGGFFQRADDVPISHLATVENGALTPINPRPRGGVTPRIDALAFFDAGDGQGPQLYAAAPEIAGDAVVDGLARRTDAGWTSVVDAFDRRPESGISQLISFNDGTGDALYAAGAPLVDPVNGSRVLRWDGSEWSELPVITGLFYALAAYDAGAGPELYASGEMQLPGTGEIVRLARFSGGAWTPLLTTLDIDGRIFSLKALGPFLYIGGAFEQLLGTEVWSAARWDGSAWTGFGELQAFPGSSGVRVQDFELFDDGSGEALYITGAFDRASGFEARNIARWDDVLDRWEPLAVDLQDDGTALLAVPSEHGNSLFAAGGFALALN